MAQSAELDRYITRREFISRVFLVGGVTLAGLDAGLVVLQPLVKYLREPHFPETSSEYGVLVENRFGIKLTQQPPASWDSKKTLVLGEVLSHLPPYIYAPRGEDRLEITLSKDPPEEDGTCCSGGYDVSWGIAYLRNRDIREDFRPLVADTIIHELAHHRNSLSANGPEQSIKEVIAEDFGLFSASVNQKISAEFNVLSDNQTEDSIQQYVLRRMQYGLTNSLEMVAVLSELYTWGEGIFSKMSAWIDKDKVEVFYDVVKFEIFDGKEYKNHAEIEGKLKFDPTTGIPIEVGFLGIDKTKK